MNDKNFTPSRFTIRVKLMVIISSILFLSLASIIMVATYFFKEDNEIRVKENNIKITEVIALNVKSEINALKQSLQVTMSVISQSKTDSSIKQILFREDPNILYVGVYDKANQPGVRIGNTQVLEDLGISTNVLEEFIRTNKDRFKQSFNNTTVLLNSSIGFRSPILAIGFPYSEDKSNKIIIAMIRLEKFLEAFQTSGNIETFMVNDEGRIIAHSDVSMILSGANMVDLPIVQKMRTSTLDNGQFRYKGADDLWFLGSFKKIGLGGVGIISTVSEDKAFEEVYNIQRRNIYLMIAALNLAIIIVFFFAKRISEPILTLVTASKNIESGNYHLELKPETRDEIGILTNSFQSMSQGLEEREKLKVSFGRFVNDEIAELSMKGQLKVGGEKKECAILFSDIRSFTSISEKLRPEEVVEFLNQYMSAMVSCVKNNRGYVDKFIGDAIMATWGALKSSGNISQDSVKAALDMRFALLKFNQGRGTAKKPSLRIGIGLNYGPVISGQIGSDEKMEYTVIGDAVNLASRVEGLTKDLSLDIIVSESIYNNTKKLFNYYDLPAISVKGKEKPQKIYALLGALNDKNCPQNLNDLRSLIGYPKPKK
ncbi:adenylate/guanylate cyclase domain-containing protein [Leptospira sp. GIMC2001]|uniref:adenylate/guanylate cyclase domain-containing protein n=1 Tax=Leptospira sp. GIMC2001 TaxID=1513297 RepID=UPI0023491A50|nr:adenylate/guanylate cyclase domain-containing protein [Leptospira sp. GIMC2001]WCL50043.1 HAMP domain-containing protein [Leptospira sp. GIMC2001]